MKASDLTTEPLPPQRSLYMQRSAARARKTLARFSDSTVEYSPTALQLLDEWIDRMAGDGVLSLSAEVSAAAFLGQMFLIRHGGYWATQTRGQKEHLGVVCPVSGPGDKIRFINIAEQIRRRAAEGISQSLAFFYLSVSIDLQGRS